MFQLSLIVRRHILCRHWRGDDRVKRRHPFPKRPFLAQRRSDVKIRCAQVRLANRLFQLLQFRVRRALIRKQRLQNLQQLWKHHAYHLFDVCSLIHRLELILSTQRVQHQHRPAQLSALARRRGVQPIQHLIRHLRPTPGEIMMNDHSHRLHELTSHLARRVRDRLQRDASNRRFFALVQDRIRLRRRRRAFALRPRLVDEMLEVNARALPRAHLRRGVAREAEKAERGAAAGGGGF
mmetsp:Transcript_1614/g.6445  ORF Transcript_1614/g.6445 Transcript_1614/m.6445 type:complete len:237 (+) Transcript_1614:4490-5200(+)